MTTEGWQAGRYFMARVAGLPLSAVDGLRCPSAAQWADAVLALRVRLRDDAATVSDLLYELISANDDEAVRRRLLKLRRQVFNSVLPDDPGAALEAVAKTQPGAADAVAQWIELRTRLKALETEGATGFARETAMARGHLWRLADEPRLRRGIQVASPTLDEQLDAYRPPDMSRAPNKRVRRAERSLLSYVYRTACKTSPFSTFTGIAWGRFKAEAEERLAIAGDWQGYARLNVVIVARLADLIGADLDRRAALRVGLSPGWRRDADRIRYVRHWVKAGDDQAAVSFDSVRDGLFFLRRSGVLDELTTFLHEHGEVRCADVVAWLCERTGAGRPDGEEYLSTLLELGMLRLIGFDTDVHADDPLSGVRTTVKEIDQAWARNLTDRLGDLGADVALYSRAELAQRRSLRHRMRTSVREAMEMLGADAAVPQVLLYEDARIGDSPLVIEERTWRTLAPDLAAVEGILPAFDQTLPHRIMLRGFFQARFGTGGRCDDLLRLVEDFHDDLYDQYSSYTASRRPFADDGTYTPEENWLGRPEMAALDKARQTMAGRMRELAAAGTDEAHLPRWLLAEVEEQLSAAATGFRPLAHFVQPALRPDGPLLVLNQVAGGLSFPFSRFTHCFEGDNPPLSQMLRAHADAVAPPGAVFAELTGGAATSNLNLHADLTEYVIVCPGESSRLPADRRLTLDDLYLEHDAEADRIVLRSVRLGREVIPVYLGYLVPMALPRIPRTLMLLSPASMIRLDVWRGVPAEPGAGGVAVRPRVSAGRIVLARREWTVRAVDLPATGDPGSDPAAFLAWRAWRAEHRLPAQVFATVHPASGGSGNPKPQYVDFDSPLSLQVFQAGLEHAADLVVLREMLPGPDDLIACGPLGEHVAELAVETFRTDPREIR